MTSRSEPGRTSFFSRSFLYIGLAILLLVTLFAFAQANQVSAQLRSTILEGLVTEARVASDSLPQEQSDLAEWVEATAQASGHRYTVIASNGSVLADSHADPADMEDHADRAEVIDALGGVVGFDTRVSATTGFEQHYVALPPRNGLIVRVSVSEREVADAVAAERQALLLGYALLAVAGLAAAALVSKLLAAPVGRLSDQAVALAAGSGQAVARSPIRELDKAGVAVSELSADLRERVRQAERATDSLEIVLGALPQGTVLFSEEDAVVYANPAAYELLGAVPDNLSGLAPFAFQDAVRHCRQTRQGVEQIVEHGRPVRRLRGTATPFASDERVLLVVFDVTDRDRAASVRRDFVANASHELKTPVSAIVASSEALQIAAERGDDVSKFARQIEHSARQLDRLVADLLDLSRLERDQPELDPLSLDLLVREEVERIRPVAEERGIALDFDLEPIEIAGSRRDVAIAVRNLLDNAVRYTASGGSVSAMLHPMGGEAVLEIVDTGEGIPTRDLDRVFERFYRVDSARARATGGTGLGLAIVKHVVESHGGEVGVESELGAGSKFTVKFPIAPQLA